jgi:hypothetical protein
MLAAKPPRDAVVLFDGSGLGAWKSVEGGPATWTVRDEFLETKPGAGDIVTKAEFGDVQLHAEWRAPSPPSGQGQSRGNSGIFLMGQFEVQVLDSYKADTYADGQAGAIYGQFPPLSNASRPPGQWQSYDIAFRRPRFDRAGKLLEPARITVFHNGVLVQNNEEPLGPTNWLRYMPYKDTGDRGPIKLQDHDHPVRFRNLWVRELAERPGPAPADLERSKIVKLSASLLDRVAGHYVEADEGPNGPKITVAREDDHLTVLFPFRPVALVMEPISETEFDMPYTDGRFTFRLDSKGRSVGALFRIGDGERHLKRVGP